MEPHTLGSSDTLYQLGRIGLIFGLIGIAVWLVIKLMLRSGKRVSNDQLGMNRQQRRAERARMKRQRRQSAQEKRHKLKRH